MNKIRNYNHEISDSPTILCPCSAPKRLLTSTNWICRNDSSNVSAILHPENYLFSPRLKYDEKSKGDVIVKSLLSKNNCYCRCKGKKLPRPTFFHRPNSCVSYETLSKRKGAAEYENDLKRKSLCGCVCNELNKDDNGPESLRSRAMRLKQATSLPVEIGLKYTNQREKYEKYRKIQQQKLQDQLEKYDGYDRYQKLEECLGEGTSDNVDTIFGTQNFDTATSTSNYGRANSVRSETEGKSAYDFGTDEYPIYSEYSVPDFRREHYFETHDIGKLGKTTVARTTVRGAVGSETEVTDDRLSIEHADNSSTIS